MGNEILGLRNPSLFPFCTDKTCWHCYPFLFVCKSKQKKEINITIINHVKLSSFPDSCFTQKAGMISQHLGGLLDPGALRLIAVLVTAKQTLITHAISPPLKASQYFLLLFISHLGLYNIILWTGQRKQQLFISYSSGAWKSETRVPT